MTITTITPNDRHTGFYGENPLRVSADPILRIAAAAKKAQPEDNKPVINSTLGCALDEKGEYTSPDILVKTAREIINSDYLQSRP